MDDERRDKALLHGGMLQADALGLDVEGLEQVLRVREAQGEAGGPEFYLQSMRDVIAFAKAVRENFKKNGAQRIRAKIDVVAVPRSSADPKNIN